MITILNLMKRVCKSNRVNNALKEAQTKEKANTKSKSTLVPKGWFVSEAGQNPLHMLWFVVLVSFDDIANNIQQPRYFMSEEKDSFEEALKDCINQITE